MPGRSPTVVVTVRHLQVLHELSHASAGSESTGQRARIILLAFERKPNAEIAQQVGLHRNQVGQWRKRWVQAFDHLVDLECAGNTSALYQAIVLTLSDSHRSGRPSFKAPSKEEQ